MRNSITHGQGCIENNSILLGVVLILKESKCMIIGYRRHGKSISKQATVYVFLVQEIKRLEKVKRLAITQRVKGVCDEKIRNIESRLKDSWNSFDDCFGIKSCTPEERNKLLNGDWSYKPIKNEWCGDCSKLYEYDPETGEPVCKFMRNRRLDTVECIANYEYWLYTVRERKPELVYRDIPVEVMVRIRDELKPKKIFKV